MALGFGAVVLDGPRTKIFTITSFDDDVAEDFPVDFSAVGFATDLPDAPIEYFFQRIVGPDTANSAYGLDTPTAGGIHIHKTGGGGAHDPITLLVVVRATHSIEQ